MLCKKCGETLQPEEKFCPNCGEKNEIGEEKMNETIETGSTSSGSYQTQTNSQKEQPVSSPQEQKDFNFNSAYRTKQQQSSGGIGDFIHQASDKINTLMDPVIRTFVNMKQGIWVLWGIAVLFSAITTQLKYSGSLIGKIFLSMITVSIVFGIELVLVQFISRSINFEYGFSKNTSSERNLLIMTAIAVINLLSMIGIFLRLNRLHLGVVGAILVAIFFALILESMFYRYFVGDQAVEFIKKYLIVQIIFAIIRFVVITVIISFVFATIFGGIFGGAMNGMREMNQFFQLFK